MYAHQFARGTQADPDPVYRGFANELAFRAFARVRSIGRLRPDFVHVEGEWEATADYIRSLDPLGVPEDIESDLLTESLALSRKTGRYFSSYHPGAAVVLWPEFSGCGRLETCQGDLLADGTLYEVKAGARPFRLVDLRQALTYCALNYAESRYEIDHLALLNPRRGVVSRHDLDLITQWGGGVNAIELFEHLLSYLTEEVASQ